MSARLGLLAALAAVIAWAAMFTVLKHLLLHLDPYWLTSIRYLGASLLLALMLLAREGVAAFRPDGRFWLLFGVGTAGIAVFNLLVLTGLQHSSAQDGALLVACGPAMVTFIAWARTRVAPRPFTFAMLALAFTGVMIVVTKGRLDTLAHGSAFGDALIALGVAGIAIYTAYTPAFNDYSRLRFTALSLIYGTISTVVASAIATALGVARVPVAFTAADAWGMLYMIAIAAILAFFLWAYAVSALGAPNAALFMNGVPIAAFIIGITLGAHFSAVEYAGAALTIAALAANNLATRATARSDSAPHCSAQPRSVESAVR